VSKQILDASALLALLNQEPGHEAVADALLDDAVASAVNVAEVVSRLSERGMPADDVTATIGALPLQVMPFDAAQAYATGRLRPLTKALGLSLGDRACLALAMQLGCPALTADRSWTRLPLDVAVKLIR
jgi:PIN domain nuclease of toxin-antitoxin system